MKYIKKWTRYLVFCPVLFLPGQVWKKFGHILMMVYIKYISDYFHIWKEAFCAEGITPPARHLILAAAMICGVVLLWFRSVQIYTFNPKGQPEYLGRYPVIWAEKKILIFPRRNAEKSRTGSYYLKFHKGALWGDSCQKEKELILVTGKEKKTLPLSRICAFTLDS